VSADDRCSGGRLGVFGGTFDPIHTGHLALAEEARTALQLDRVIFVPVGHPWRKTGREITAASGRMAMVSSAIAANPFFEVSSIEVDRGGPTYTVETLQVFHERFGASTHLWFIVGSDALLDLQNWREPEQIVALARLAVADRSDGRLSQSGGELNTLEVAIPGVRERIDLIAMPRLDISSSELRRRLREGISCRYLMPEEVEQYAISRRLYERDPVRQADAKAAGEQ
jgi:nicotinate-nucleotide adenylyltransferase